MTHNLVHQTGKLLFPDLARDQRKCRMRVILLVMTASLFTAGGLTTWMTLTSISTSHIIMISGISAY